MAADKIIFDKASAARIINVVRKVEGEIRSRRSPSLGPPRDRGGQGGSLPDIINIDSLYTSDLGGDDGLYLATTVNPDDPTDEDAPYGEQVIVLNLWEPGTGHGLDPGQHPTVFPAFDHGLKMTIDGVERRRLYIFAAQFGCGSTGGS